MVTWGLVFVILGAVLFGVAAVGATIGQRRRPGRAADATPNPIVQVLTAIVDLLKGPISFLTRAGVKWYRRAAALGQTFLIIGFALLLINVLGGSDGGGEEDPPGTTSPSSSTT